MGSWWRSQDMTYVSLIISEEAAIASIRELGVLGCIQFVDLNPDLTPFQRRFVSYVKRCDEIERKIRYVHGEVKKLNIPVQPVCSIDSFIERSLDIESGGTFVLDTLESKLDLYERQLSDLNKYSAKLTEEYSHKVFLYNL
jgi:V-type H+-transporting ATPase subunit a